MTLDTLLSAIAIPIAGWALYRVSQIDGIKEDLAHVRERVDNLYDHLIGPEANRKSKTR